MAPSCGVKVDKPNIARPSCNRPKGDTSRSRGNVRQTRHFQSIAAERRVRALAVARVSAMAVLATGLIASASLAWLIKQQPNALRPSPAVQARLAAAMQDLADDFVAYARSTFPHPTLDWAGLEQKLRDPDAPPFTGFDLGEAPAGDENAAETVDRISRTLAVGRGDTLMKLLVNAGVERGESQEVVTALRRLFDPRKLTVGQELTFTFARDEGALKLTEVAFAPSVERSVAVRRTAEGEFKAEQTVVPLTPSIARATGKIDDSLFLSARRHGMPMPVLAELIKLFSYDVDFQREIQPGDSFDVVFDRMLDPNGRPAKDGEIVYASMTLSGQTLRYWRYSPSDTKEAEYFNDKGQSVRKALLRTPIDGARLTSSFGVRRHPILGYNAVHKGVDFGAATGTPIQAAGDGVVEMAGWNGGYGKYVRIKHNGTFSTAYAHMSTFARDIAPGRRVRQGQVIGYVGTTGRSTGPHLHYEVLRDGKQINPLSVRFPTGRILEGRELQRFRETIRQLEARGAEATLVTASAD
jgi:murein DD-endopeptidase MepM/ murein hydrolase activator NlpD